MRKFYDSDGKVLEVACATEKLNSDRTRTQELQKTVCNKAWFSIVVSADFLRRIEQFGFEKHSTVTLFKKDALVLICSWGIKDTQCGFKVFHREIGEFLSRLQKINRFAFDIELLCLAQLSGFKIKEIPVRWVHCPDSRVRPIRDSMRSFVDLVKIKIYTWSQLYSRKVDSYNQWKDSHCENSFVIQ